MKDTWATREPPALERELYTSKHETSSLFHFLWGHLCPPLSDLCGSGSVFMWQHWRWRFKIAFPFVEILLGYAMHSMHWLLSLTSFGLDFVPCIARNGMVRLLGKSCALLWETVLFSMTQLHLLFLNSRSSTRRCRWTPTWRTRSALRVIWSR